MHYTHNKNIADTMLNYIQNVCFPVFVELSNAFLLQLL